MDPKKNKRSLTWTCLTLDLKAYLGHAKSRLKFKREKGVFPIVINFLCSAVTVI